MRKFLYPITITCLVLASFTTARAQTQGYYEDKNGVLYWAGPDGNWHQVFQKPNLVPGTGHYVTVNGSVYWMEPNGNWQWICSISQFQTRFHTLPPEYQWPVEDHRSEEEKAQDERDEQQAKRDQVLEDIESDLSNIAIELSH